MAKNIIKFKEKAGGFTLVEIMISLVISAFLIAAVYNFFISQNHAYSVQDQVIDLEQNSRSTINMIRQELRMAGYNAMGAELINNLSNWVPSGFIPTSPMTVNLDANPKITDGGSGNPDMITFLSVLPSANNPTTFGPVDYPTNKVVAAGSTTIKLSLNSSETADQYNVGDILHIGTCSEYAKVTGISGDVLTIDTNPTISGNQGLNNAYTTYLASGETCTDHKEKCPEVGEISVVSYALFNNENPPVLKRKVNAGAFQPVAENITDMQLSHLGSGEVAVTLTSRTDKPDREFPDNGGYRTLDTQTKIKVRNTDTVSGGNTCAAPGAPQGLTLAGLNANYPCRINITWTAPADVDGCPLTGYTVYYDDKAGVYGNSIDVPANVTDYDLVLNHPTYPKPLQACSYYVSVSGSNSGGTGPKATAQITDSIPPDQPTLLKAENMNGIERSVRLSWTANTDCDLKGYNLYRKTEGGSYDYTTPVNSSPILKSSTFATDAILPIPSDCDTYYYVIRAMDICPNYSADSNEMSAAPANPAPPTDGTFATDAGTGLDTIGWKPSPDDFMVETTSGDQNYVDHYNVYYGDTLLLPTVAPVAGSITYSYPYTPDSPGLDYEVSVTDQCGKESDRLVIKAACTETPTITDISPANGSTVSGTQTISGNVTVPTGRTISSVQIKIDNSLPVAATVTGSTFSYPWVTNTYTNSNHTIRVTVKDSQDCTSNIDFTVRVNNDLTQCPDKPIITIATPASGATVSGTQIISGTIDANNGKTIRSVKIYINSVEVFSVPDPGASYAFSFTWDTASYPGGSYPIEVTAVDSGGCISTSQITVTVSKQLYCKLYACKADGNEEAYVAAYVYDLMKNPVSGATVTITFSANSSNTITGQTDTTGWFTGTSYCPTGGTKYTSTAAIEPSSLTLPSNLSESSHKMKSGDTISVTAKKTGYVTSAQRSISLSN